jgi:hypothetical protein
MTTRAGIVCATAFAIGLAISGNQAFGSTSKGRPAHMPDLVVAGLRNPTAPVPASGTFAVRVSIRNSGRVRAGRSLTGFYLSSDRRRSRGDQRLGARRVGALPRKTVSRRVSRLIVPSGTRPASYFLVACADDRGKVRERSERNNCGTSRRTILVRDASSPLGPPRNLSPPAVSGVAEVGQVLTVSDGRWSGAQPLTYAYRWRRCNASGLDCVDLADAAAQRYAVGTADLSATLRVVVTASNVYGSQPALTNYTSVVAIGPPLYGPTSPFNTPIPADPPIDPNSSLYIAGLREVAGVRGFTISVRGWTVPAYEANTGTPRYDVQLTESWRAANWMLGVPIPSEAAPDPEDDGHMTVLDRGTGCEFDFYEAHHEDGHWTAGWANTVRTAESGVYPYAYSMRGSGFANLAGLIWPQELRVGEIRHALMFSYPYTSAAGAVEPATETDGQSTRSDALPEGARLQLDPSLDLDSLPLQPYERVIARALQRYGMYLGDTGGGINLYAVQPQSYPSDPYVGLLPSEAYPRLPNIPIDRFRVIDLGPVTPGWILQSRARLVPTGCATMRW